MNAAPNQLEDDPECRVIILTGDGPVFCGGAQLGAVLVSEEADVEWQYLVLRGVRFIKEGRTNGECRLMLTIVRFRAAPRAS